MDDARGVRGRRALEDLHGMSGATSCGVSRPRPWMRCSGVSPSRYSMTMKRSPSGRLPRSSTSTMCSRADAPGRLRLALEALHRVGVARLRCVQHLDRDAAADADVLALVDRAHAALAEQADDAVLALDDLADFERHEGSGDLTYRYITAPFGAHLCDSGAPPKEDFWGLGRSLVHVARDSYGSGGSAGAAGAERTVRHGGCGLCHHRTRDLDDGVRVAARAASALTASSAAGAAGVAVPPARAVELST